MILKPRKYPFGHFWRKVTVKSVILHSLSVALHISTPRSIWFHREAALSLCESAMKGDSRWAGTPLPFHHPRLWETSLTAPYCLVPSVAPTSSTEVGRPQRWRWGCWGDSVLPPSPAKVDELSRWASGRQGWKRGGGQAEERVQVQEHHTGQGTRSVTKILLWYNHPTILPSWISRCYLWSCRSAIALIYHTAFLLRQNNN